MELFLKNSFRFKIQTIKIYLVHFAGKSTGHRTTDTFSRNTRLALIDLKGNVR